MKAGEQFLVVEDEVGGWTKVRRLVGEDHDEGYVPSSYVRLL